MIDLADLIVFGNRVRGRRIQLSAVNHTDTDVGLSNVDISHLLIHKVFGHSFLRVCIQFG